MNITENLIRIKQGKDDIITALQNKGSDISNDTLINEISTYVDKLEIGGGGGDTPVQPETPELVQKYEGASVFRINVPTDNYEFAINLCNDSTKATYDVDWGDGSLESGLTTDEQHHIYSKKGVYDVNIYNLSKNITLGGTTSIGCFTGGSKSNNTYTQIVYLFNNSNNDINGLSYIEFKDNICTNIFIGDKITSIGSNAFQNCFSLQSIELPSTLTTINNYAFQNCTSLQSIELPSTLTTINNHAFHNCTSLQNIVLPSTLKTINDDAFSGCSSLQSIVIPEGVTTINNYAFQNCSSLQSIVIPEGVTTINNDVFSYCSSLQSIELPTTLKSIYYRAFSYCSSLQSIVLPEGVTTINNNAFQNCFSLQSIVIPETVTSIGSSVFSYCSSLQSIELPSTLTTIGSSVFQNCYYLRKIVSKAITAPTTSGSLFPSSNLEFSKTYLYISKDSVGYDSGNWKTSAIEIIYLEDYEKTPTELKLKTKNNKLINLPYIGQAKLIDYELIDNEYIYHFDDKITEIPRGFFTNNPILQSIVIPETVTSIGSSVFQNCYSLQSITCKAITAPTIQSNTFTNIGTKVPTDIPKVLRVPEGATGYDSGNWKNYVISKGYTLEYFKL